VLQRTMCYNAIVHKENFFLIYPENTVVVVQYNILKIFTMYFSKINQTYFIIVLLMNERINLHKIVRNIMLSQDYHIFRVNSKKKFSLCRVKLMCWILF